MTRELLFYHYQEIEKEIEKIARHLQVITLIMFILIAFLNVLFLMR
ncbi:MAG: hypothetical protein ABIK81_03780 [candidate division WOR-3 bacterium]